MRDVKVSLFPGLANIELDMKVVLHSGATEDDLHEIVRRLFPHMEEHSVFAEFVDPEPETKTQS